MSVSYPSSNIVKEKVIMKIDDIVVCIETQGHLTITKGNHYKILDIKSSKQHNNVHIFLVKSDMNMRFWVSGASFTTPDKYREHVINNILK